MATLFSENSSSKGADLRGTPGIISLLFKLCAFSKKFTGLRYGWVGCTVFSCLLWTFELEGQ